MNVNHLVFAVILFIKCYNFYKKKKFENHLKCCAEMFQLSRTSFYKKKNTFVNRIALWSSQFKKSVK